MRKRSITVDVFTITEEELAPLLRRFYAEVRKDNGKPLTPSSLVGIRAAISRYLVAAPFYRNMNIVSGSNFTVANRMFDTKCKLYYKCNNPKPKHKPVIEEQDMKKLSQYFKNYYQSPIILTEKVWFLLCFHFGRRGREGWAEMKKDFFTINESPQGDFVECSKTETLKNIQGGHKQGEQDYSENRMCGEAVEIFKFYLSKLNPGCDRLFQYPVNSFQITSDVWYANKPIGKKEECSSILSSSVFGPVAASSPNEQNNVESITIVPRIADHAQQETRSMESVPSNNSGMIAKYSELFGTCTFNNCEIKFC